MKIIDFPNSNEGNTPSEAVLLEYQYQMEIHKNYLKFRSRQNLFYIKSFGCFLLIACSYFITKNNLNFSNFLMSIVVIGVSTLLIMLTNLFFLDPQWDWEFTSCVNAGKNLEKKYPHLIPSQLFHHFDHVLWGAPFSRFIPFAFVLLLTAAAGVMLAVKVSVALAVSLGVLSLFLLTTSAFFFKWVLHKRFRSSSVDKL